MVGLGAFQAGAGGTFLDALPGPLGGVVPYSSADLYHAHRWHLAAALAAPRVLPHPILPYPKLAAVLPLPIVEVQARPLHIADRERQ